MSDRRQVVNKIYCPEHNVLIRYYNIYVFFLIQVNSVSIIALPTIQPIYSSRANCIKAIKLCNTNTLTTYYQEVNKNFPCNVYKHWLRYNCGIFCLQRSKMYLRVILCLVAFTVFIMTVEAQVPGKCSVSYILSIYYTLELIPKCEKTIFL